MQGSISIRSSDLAPVASWLAELRGRVEQWSQGVRAVSSDEWSRLQTSVKGALSTRRVEQVLRDFLHKIGVPARGNTIDSIEDLSIDLKARIISYREGQTIESYAEYVSPPPTIEL